MFVSTKINKRWGVRWGEECDCEAKSCIYRTEKYVMMVLL